MMLMENEIPMATVDKVRQMCPIANWFADDTWRFWAYSRHIAHHFSWVVTTSRKAKQAYDRMPGVRAHLSPWGYDPATFHPVDVEPTLDVGFVGQRYGRRARIIERLQAQGLCGRDSGHGLARRPYRDVGVGHPIRIHPHQPQLPRVLGRPVPAARHPGAGMLPAPTGSSRGSLPRRSS